MKKIRRSARTIECFREMFPGEWRAQCNQFQRKWTGSEFSIVYENGKFVRTDTGEQVRMPVRKSRKHFIHSILSKMFGGKWVRHPYRGEWSSVDHDFKVYRTTDHKGGRARTAYRRSDSGKVVYLSNGRKFY